MKRFVIPLLFSVLASPVAADEYEFWVLGGNVFEDVPQGHQLFSPSVSTPHTSLSGTGIWTEVGVAYGPGAYQIGLTLQNVEVDRGRPFTFVLRPEMGVSGTIVDLAYSRDVTLAGMDIEWSAALRYAEFTTSIDSLTPDLGPTHEFSGIGIRVGAESSGTIGAVSGLEWFGAAGLSVIPGTIETSARGSWLCNLCTATDVTALGLDLRIGIDYEIAQGVSVLAGYQLQRWQDVTVQISDTIGDGAHAGTSDLLIHGVFAGISARW